MNRNLYEFTKIRAGRSRGPARGAAIALVGAMALGACAGLPDSEPLGSVQVGIDNGDPATDPNTVQVITTLQDNSTVVGSGFLLDGQTVITAAHLVYDLTGDRSVPPSRVKVLQTAGGQQLSVISLVTHPTFVKAQLTADHQASRDVFDVAVLKLRNNIDGVTPRNVTTRPAGDFAAGGYRVVGFSPTLGVGLQSFVPQSTGVSLASASKHQPTLLRADPITTPKLQFIESTDAGGPALSLGGDTGNLVAISMFATSPDNVSQLLFLPSVKGWLDLVRGAMATPATACRTRRAMRGSLPADDYFASLAGDTLTFYIEYGNDGDLPTKTTATGLTGELACGNASSLGFVQVNASNTTAVVAQVGAAAITRLVKLASPTSPPTLSPGPSLALPVLTQGAKTVPIRMTGFENVQLSDDLAGKDLPGISAIASSGEAYMFSARDDGSGTGTFTYSQVMSRKLYGFPTADGTDGKFVVVISDGLATLVQTTTDYYIQVPNSDHRIRVDLFDGDLAGLNDLGAVDTCFTLYADPLGNGAGTTKIKQTSASQITTRFGNDMWTVLWDDVESPAAAAVDFHVYRLNVVLGSNCTTTTSGITGALNAFKIRSNGQVSIEKGHISFFGGDSSGDFTAFTAISYGDYNYDGTFPFYIDAGSAGNKQIMLEDYDADNLTGDPPGVADGANREINWSVTPVADTDPPAAPVVPCKVSGAYQDPVFTGEQVGATLSKPNTWAWRWTDVLITNAIHVEVRVEAVPACGTAPPQLRAPAATRADAATAAPETTAGAAQYAIFGATVTRRRVTDSVPATTWVSQVLQGAFSPVVVGAKTSCSTRANRTVLLSAGAASTALGSTATVFDQLVSELIATRLNIQRGAAGAAGVDEALVYGHTFTVASVVQAAELAVGQGRGAVPDAQLAGLLEDLHRINQGELTYVGSRAILPFKGGGDVDSDAIPDQNDNCPAVANPGQADRNLDGIGDACDPKPRLACIDRRPGGGFTAHFSVDHAGPDVFVVRGGENAVTGSAALQPTHFPVGTGTRVFSAPSTGGNVTWTVLGNTAVASATSPACDALQIEDLPLGAQAVLYATDELRIDERAVIADCSDAVSAGATQTFVGAGAQVGDVYSQAGVFVGGQATVGIVASAGSVSPQAGAKVQAVTPLATAPVAPAWSVVFPGGAHPPVSVDAGRAATIAPGSYGAVHVSSNARLDLAPGKYFFDSLSVESAGAIAITGAGPLQIYVAGELTFRGTVAREATLRGAPDLVIAAFGSNASVVEAGLRAHVAVPNGQLVLGSGAPVALTGRFTGRRIEVRSGVTLSLE